MIVWVANYLLLSCRSQSSPVDDASSYLQHIFKEATNFEELNKVIGREGGRQSKK